MSQPRNMVVQKQEDEVARAKGHCREPRRHRQRRAGKLYARKLRLSSKREIQKVRAAQEKLRKELCKEVKMKVKGTEQDSEGKLMCSLVSW